MMESEANLTKAYRQARREFISACEKMGADVVGRVHPERGPDGKPLFCDCAAFGPREAECGLLMIAAAQNIIPLLQMPLPNHARLVMVHDPDPYARAWGKPGPKDWPQKSLATIATEDLRRVKKLTVLDLSGVAQEAVLKKALPDASVTFRMVKPEHAEKAFQAAIAGL